MQKKECIAMVLAGGEGSRLGVLTENNAKPAVIFGGKYRIIDFTLSNCANANIDTVGLLTQYQPLTLHTHIGTGKTWGLEGINRGITLLPPYQSRNNNCWYTGTADAIYQNISYIDKYSPEYVLVLSGDHIYKMDYNLMLHSHKKAGAKVSIATIEVPWKDTHRFGIIKTNASGRIEEFQEKPKKPKNNLASMGIYIFHWQTLKQYLIQDEEDTTSSHDFGKNILPRMLSNNVDMYAYRFEGYWRDVGTLQSYWESNMDLLSEHCPLDLYDAAWQIYAGIKTQAPNYITSTANISDTLINEGCIIAGEVNHSILSPGCMIGTHAKVHNAIIMPNVQVGSNVIIENAIIGENTIISDGCYIGYSNENSQYASAHENNNGLTVISENLIIPENTMLKKNTIANQEAFENIRLLSSYVS